MSSTRGKPIRPAKREVINDQALKERRFAIEYLRVFDGRKAAEAMGMEGASAARFATSALKKPHVRELILDGIDNMSARIAITEDKTIREIARIAFANVYDLIERDGEDGEGGAELRLERLNPEIGAAVAGIDKIEKITTTAEGETVRTVTHKLKMVDKRAALSDLAKIMTLFAEDRNKIDEIDVLSKLYEQMGGGAGGSRIRPQE